MTMSDLPKDLVEDIFSRLPFKSKRTLQLTCKKWNDLFKSQSFMKMHIGREEAAAREAGETRMIVMMDYNVHLMGIVFNDNPSLKSLGKLRCLPEQVRISEVIHCEGLLLCILKDDNTKIVVWNPYLGQIRWIQIRKRIFGDFYNYTLGYGNNSKNEFCRSPKILRCIDYYSTSRNPLQYEIYDFDSGLWTTLDVSPQWRKLSHRGISLKGNTYWAAIEHNTYACHIIYFDFTRERFESLLPLPYNAWDGLFSLSLSSIREEKVAVLLQKRDRSEVEIGITTKIDAKNVTWSSFFTVNLSYFDRSLSDKSFFIDEEKKVAVVFDKGGETIGYLTHDIINIIGEAGCLRKLELGEPADKSCWPLACSYVPSIVQINQAT